MITAPAPSQPPESESQDIVIFSRELEAAERWRQVLRHQNLDARVVDSIDALRASIDIDLGAVLLDAEQLDPSDVRELVAALERQPDWSELPILLISDDPEREHALVAVLHPAHVFLLRRPLTNPMLLSTVRAALNSRRRQYRIRHRLQRLEARDSLRRPSDERLELAVAGSESGFWDIQQHHGKRRVCYLSPQQKQLIGFREDELPSSIAAWRARVHPDDIPRLRRALRAAWRRGHFEVEYRIRHRDGSWRWLLSRGRIERSRNAGRALRWSGLDWDITERKEAEIERERLAAIVACTHDAIIGIELDGTIISWNDAARRLYGYTEAEILGKSLHRLEAPEQAGATDRLLEVLRRSEAIDSQEMIRLGKNGERIHVQLSASPATDPDGRLRFAAAIERDITEHKRLQAQLEHEAQHDPLTGLPNRGLLTQRLEFLIARQRRRSGHYAVLMMDLDNFKVVNDSLGHLAGDRLLIEIGQRIRYCLRPTDTLSRLGGDEFGVLLSDLRAADDVLRVVKRIQAALQEPVLIGGQEVRISISIGITLGDPSYEHADALLRDADTALHEAKLQGRNSYVIFDEPMRAAVVSRMRLENRLRRAIDEGSLMAHFQPIVAIGSGRIIGCEALARWRDPELGNVSPAQFIPVAEESGLIVPLGEHVLDLAAAALARWRRRGLARGVYVSVNLSARQIQQIDLVDMVLATLARHGLRGTDLRLEITETIMVHSEPYSIDMLSQLREHGIAICMDDFGTGYSSLSYLREFPFDVLKIDKSFVQSIARDKTTREIVRTVSRLADGLMLEAIAEGVETDEHLETLKALGLRWAQGFHFYRALHSDVITSLFRGHHHPTVQ